MVEGPKSTFDWFGSDVETDALTIALGIDRTQNRELLEDLLSSFETTVAGGGEIPAETDLCIVDPGGFSRLRDELERWKSGERPAAAPVLLLGKASETDLWTRYAGNMGRYLDAVQPIPAPKRAVSARIRGLLEIRRYSMAAKRRYEQLELYRRVMDGAGVGITIADATDPDLPLVYVNGAFEAATGYDRDSVLGRNCRFLQGDRTDPSTVERIREAIAAEEPISVEIRNYRASGESFWNDLDIVPVVDDSGDVTHFFGVQEDVTERRRREADLERYEQVIQSIDDPVIVCDARRRVELANDAAVDIFGDASGITDETSVTALFPPDARTRVREALSAVERTGDPQERQFTIDTRGELGRLYQFRFQRERSTAGTPLSRIIVIGRDATTLREYQSRLSVLDRVLRHNLRNKLTIIAGNTDLLTDPETEHPPETVAGIIDSIDEAVDDLLGLAEAARQFHRSIEPGARTGIAVELEELIGDLLVTTEGEFPEADVRADVPEPVAAICPSTIRMNLEWIVENAIVYADSPHPTVRIATRYDADTVEIRIVDRGPGIPEREREALGRGTETPLEHLQGVSLWLVNWAVRSVGGEFEIRDNEPAGTVVVLRLPRADS